VSGADIDTGRVEEEIREYVSGRGLGGDIIRDILIATIVNADDGIAGIASLSTAANGTSFSGDEGIGPRESPETGTITVNVI